MTGLGGLTAATRAICAPGTDAAAAATVLAWSCGPRRSLDVLRRRLRDGDGGDDADDAPGTIADRLAHIARSDGGLDGPLADVALRNVRTWARLGVRIALVGDPAYPSVLADGWPELDPPVLLAWRGQPPGDAGSGVALVGARNATAYGTSVAEMLAEAVARAGGRVVSGGALGIDAAAHAAAIGLPGGTTVVLGCGHAVGYPAAHARPGGLFARVLADGGTLVSELLPEVTAHPGVIRARNRIVAGLAVVTVVVEGGSRSGALLTAGAAAALGREVLAVPGDILAPGSAAPLRLIGEGARACTGAADVLALLPTAGRTARLRADPDPGAQHVRSGRDTVAVSGTEGLPLVVMEALERAGSRGLPVEELALAHPGGAGPLLVALTRARISGTVEDVIGGVRLRPSRPPRPSGR
jgi:DNA processing protein